ncbi:MAG: hypothetical protein ACREBV_01890, partial [Candidatus Zixiibacteriota bacterium]
PSWSPDGRSILFTNEQAIFEISLGETAKTKLIDNAFYARYSPNGKKMALIRQTWKAESGWPATSTVSVVNADGTDEREITPE